MRLRLAVLLGGLFAGCMGGPHVESRATVPDESLLTEVAPAERGRVSAARVAQGRARDDHGASLRTQREAATALTEANLERTDAVAKVVRSERDLERTQDTGSTGQVDASRQVLRQAEASRDICLARCDLRDREVVSAAHGVDLASARVQLAAARVDLAKVVAVNTLARPDLQKPDVSVFEALVRNADGDESVAMAGLAAAEREVAVSRGRLVERESGR
jgi:hypothetical protein